MNLSVRRWLVAGAVVLSGGVVAGRGAMAQQAPTTSTSTTTTLDEGVSTTFIAPTSTAPTTAVSDPPELTVTLGYVCPASAGTGLAVPGLSVGIVNRGGTAVVDIVVEGVTAPQLAGIEVPQSYLGIAQQFSFLLPEGEPDDGVAVDVVESGTGRVLAGAGFDHRPQCEGPYGGFLVVRR